MYACSGIAGQQCVPGDDGFLGRARPARQTQQRRVGSLMRDGADGEAGLFGVLGDEDTKAGCVFKRTPHDQWIVHAETVVGEHPHLPGAGGHHAHLGELRTCQTHRDGAHRMHVDEADLLTAVPHMVGDDRAVGDRVGIGHREYRGVAAQSRCRRAGFDVLGILPAGLAQVSVQVDEAGQQNLAGRVDDIGIVGNGKPGTDVGDLAVGHEHVDPVTLTVKPHPADQDAVITAPRVCIIR